VLPTYDHRESGIRPNNKFGWNEEYRAYVGYTGTDGVNYLGLPPHTSMTVPVPMAIWDSGRLNIVEDAQSTEDLLLNDAIPFTYDASALRYAESIGNLQTRPGNIQNAMLLLYHSGTALGINSDLEHGWIPKSTYPGTAATGFQVTRLTEASFMVSTRTRSLRRWLSRCQYCNDQMLCDLDAEWRAKHSSGLDSSGPTYATNAKRLQAVIRLKTALGGRRA
jgi:hypothetical protein